MLMDGGVRHPCSQALARRTRCFGCARAFIRGLHLALRACGGTLKASSLRSVCSPGGRTAGFASSSIRSLAVNGNRKMHCRGVYVGDLWISRASGWLSFSLQDFIPGERVGADNERLLRIAAEVLFRRMDRAEGGISRLRGRCWVSLKCY